MDGKFYDLAVLATESAAGEGIKNIDPRWVYSQWQHESDHFTSQLAVENHNLGGLTQIDPNDSPQPDGNYYYINFASDEEYAVYFGRYLRYFLDSGIDQASTLTEYIIALKNSPSGAYFGDSLENYLADCQKIYNENFLIPEC
ncbi:glycoside hydrolase family 73 protein [Candidatus Desulfosporosinus infrequens]|uniref:Glycoside hydrolase family 73 protein n=1 Tax=Candidatus Desulfosporosinus infrequens TaxID=2043169 RepID=A0A2U3LXJ6_9FIRM|nr:glycoside hydrolase family 73 protein [Candidatus Desulfosporosinus infrequens]